MRKKALFGLLAIPLVFLLSSCFMMSGFWLAANSVIAGGKGTKAVFEIHPTRLGGDNNYQFFLVGVDDGNDLRVTKARWGTNGTFGGPYPLGVSANLATTIGSDCQSNGFDLSSVTGVTWKGFVTPTSINDRNRVNKDVIVQAGVKAVDGATTGDWPVIGVTGAWADDGDGTPEASDDFLCTGVSQVSLNVST
jgi:hypothetical protein